MVIFPTIPACSFSALPHLCSTDDNKSDSAFA